MDVREKRRDERLYRKCGRRMWCLKQMFEINLWSGADNAATPAHGSRVLQWRSKSIHLCHIY